MTVLAVRMEIPRIKNNFCPFIHFGLSRQTNQATDRYRTHFSVYTAFGG